MEQTGLSINKLCNKYTFIICYPIIANNMKDIESKLKFQVSDLLSISSDQTTNVDSLKVAKNNTNIVFKNQMIY